MPRELFLLSPYRLPAQHSLMLGAEDVAALLNGYLALWHPQALRGASGPPQIASPYDHEQPNPECVYAVPESPPVFLPDDWDQRVRQAGAKWFQSSMHRNQTLAQMLDALGPGDSDPTRAAPYLGLGLGYAVLTALFEAMDHLNQLAATDFWQAVTDALNAQDPDQERHHLERAAIKLMEGREVVYPSHVSLVDLSLFHDRPLDSPAPLAMELGLPTNILLSGERFRRLAEENPALVERIREQVRSEQLEVIVGAWREREDALLPIESQLWNLRAALARTRDILGQEVRVYGRKRFGLTAFTPALLAGLGVGRAILHAFDEAAVPQFRSAIVEWPARGGKRVEAFCRAPLATDSPQTYFHLAHHLSKTMLQDASAALAFLTRDDVKETPFHRDWLELHRLGPIFGRFTTLGRLFSEVYCGEYPPAIQADEFHSDYLHELTMNRAERPVSRFRIAALLRRQFETAATLAGMLRALVRQGFDSTIAARLDLCEEQSEEGRGEDTFALIRELGDCLAGLVLSRAAGQQPGYLLFNPCSFDRCVGVSLPGIETPLPAPARGTQMSGAAAQVSVEIPGLGFAWLPRSVAAGTRVPIPRDPLALEHTLQNEFFIAEVDVESGGLRGFRHPRDRHNRIGQQLVYGPGSQMEARSIRVLSTGPALGEIISEGVLLDGHGGELAGFRQRFRCWRGRPLLELQFELVPSLMPVGYPWHGYYGARFAWRDGRSPLFRGVDLSIYPTTHPRPESPDYLVIGSDATRTTILTGGLPFHLRHSQRMLDVILIPEGESERTFDLALGAELEEPAQSVLDWLTPPVLTPVSSGPPHVGSAGWLFHVDARNLVLTSLRPAAGTENAVMARILECRGVDTQAELRCFRNPVRALVVDERDEPQYELAVAGDAVALNFAAGEMLRVRIEFA